MVTMKISLEVFLKNELKKKGDKIIKSCRLPKSLYDSIVSGISTKNIVKEFYKHIATKLKDKFENMPEQDIIFSRHDFKRALGMGYKIPRELHYKVIEDMDKQGLLKVKNKKTIIIYR